MSPQLLLERIRQALADAHDVDLRGHAEETRRAVYRARVALYAAEDLLAHRTGETMIRAGDPGSVTGPA